MIRFHGLKHKKFSPLEMGAHILALHGDNPIAQVMETIALYEPRGAFCDGIDWSDRYGWVTLSQGQIIQLHTILVNLLALAVTSPEGGGDG